MRLERTLKVCLEVKYGVLAINKLEAELKCKLGRFGVDRGCNMDPLGAGRLYR